MAYSWLGGNAGMGMSMETATVYFSGFRVCRVWGSQQGMME